jgi:hypothetical protein
VVSSVSKSWSVTLIGFLLITFSAAAFADGIDNDVLKKLLDTGKAMPVQDDTLRLTTNKDKLIRLEQDAASVIVNNPAHATVMLDSPRLLIVMPRQPGATSFSVLDAAGNTILHKEIIVTNVQPSYVRIRRMCAGNDSSCTPTSYFYCPNGCYEVTAVGDTGGGNVPPPAAPPGAKESGDSNPLQPPQNPVNSTTVPATTPGGGL